MNHAIATPPMHPALRAKLAIIVAGLALLALTFGASKLIHRLNRDQFVVPDEKAAAALLLEQKLSGPRYFQRDPAAAAEAGAKVAHGEIRIGLAAAQAQIPRIVQERHLNAETAARLAQLVEELSEPSASRVVGETTVELLRLNLALDELR